MKNIIDQQRKRKFKPIQIIIFLCTFLVAVVIISLTVGREIYEGKSDSLVSFGVVHFSGYLFFLLMPVEMAFIYYLSFYEEIQMVTVAICTAFSAQLIDYFIGYSLSTKFIFHFVGEKRIERSQKYIQKYGNLTIFLFNLSPLSSPVIALVAGMIKYRLRNHIIFSLLGLIIKYIALSLVF